MDDHTHPDRNAQFEHINAQVQAYQGAGQPVMSVDTKKKELVGDIKNGGHELRPQGDPEPVRVHDFVIPELGKATQYGVYDVTHNLGWVNVGIDHDTATFAVESIRRWWCLMGQPLYPTTRGSCSSRRMGVAAMRSRLRLWKVELQNLADETRLEIAVSHLPLGTSKWNKIEHRLFSYISQNWRGKPLISHEVIMNLIAATTTPNRAARSPAVNWTRSPMPRAPSSPTTNWRKSTCDPTISMASRTTPISPRTTTDDRVIS